MKEIEIAKWRRREHFEFFRKADLPFFNVNVNVEITGLREYAKARSLSLNSLLLHCTMHALNDIENFRFRLRGETVVVHERIHPCFTHLKDGDDLFSLITVDFVDDVFEFGRAVAEAILGANSYFSMEKLTGRDDLAFLSAMPWISFTAIDHTLSLKKEDAIPRVTWGKFFSDRGRTLLPFNIQVNHMFVDGVHVGRFLEGLQRGIAELRKQ